MSRFLQKITVYFLCFSFLTSLAQTKEEILKRVEKKYQASGSMQFSMVYNLYEDYKTNRVHESYPGVYAKKDNANTYLKINQTEFFQLKNQFVQVSHEENIIVVSAANNVKQQTNYDIFSLLEYYDISSLSDKKEFWRLTLKVKPKTNVEHSLIYIDVFKDYTIKKETFFYSTALNFSSDYSTPRLSYPRLEIVFSKPSAKPNNALWDLTKIYSVKNNKIVAASKFKNYEIIDNRKTN